MTGLLKGLIPIVSLLLLVIPYNIIKKINLKEKLQRWKQLRFVYTSILFCMVACSWFGTVSALLDRLLRTFRVQAFFNQLLPLAVLEYALTLFLAILLNSAALFIFCIIKRLDRIGMKARTLPGDWDELIKTKRPLPRYIYWAFLNMVYCFDDRSFTLRKNLVKVKHTFKYFIKIMAVLCMLAVVAFELPLLYSADWIPLELMRDLLQVIYILPAVSILVVCECFYYLDGREEFEEGGFEKERAQKSLIADYSELEDEYKRIWEKRYITTLNPFDHSNVQRTDETPGSHPVIEGIKRNLSGGFEIKPDYLRHIENILNGKDVIIDASVYSEFGEYLFRYLNVVLAKGETVLVICTDEREVEELYNYTKERLRLINSYHHIWEISAYRTNLGTNDRDILFVTPQIITNDSAFGKRFFSKLSTVIIANATESMARDNLQMSLLSFKLASIKRKANAALQYICLAESIPIGIRKALVEALELPRHLAAGDAYRVYNNTKIMLWRYEDRDADFAQDKLFPEQSPRYLGLALPLACVALKRGVDMVSIFSHNETPHVQMLDNINAIRNYLNPFFGRVQTDFDRQIVFNRYNRENRYARFAVMDDNLCNLPMIIYNSARFGGEDTTMIHIISRAYMLRDYFYVNAEKYLGSESHINMFMPSVADTAKLAVFRLLYEMYKNGLAEEEIIARVDELLSAGNSVRRAESPIRSALAYCVKKATGGDIGDSVYRHFSFQKQTRFDAAAGDFITFYRVRYKDGDVIDRLIGDNKSATVVIGGTTYVTNFRSDGIYQRYLPNQHMVFGGRAYQIRDIRNGQIHLIDGRDDCKNPACYTQIRRYTVDNSVPRPISGAGNKYDPQKCEIIKSFSVMPMSAPVEVETLGCYVHGITGDAFNYKKPLTVEVNAKAQEQARRKYAAANVLDLKIKCKEGFDTDRVVFLMAVMVNELFKTLFPYSKDCLAVCPVLNNPDTVYNDELGRHISKLYPQMDLAQKTGNGGPAIELYIIEDSKTDLGIVRSLTDNWKEMFERIFDNLREYLNWQQTYDDMDDDNISNKYLYFGRDSEPDCFDFKTLTAMLNEIRHESRAETAEADAGALFRGVCSFCGEPIQSVQINALADGRIMCARCAELIVTDVSTLRGLYRDAVKYLSSEFGITIPRSIKVKFATAESIRLRMQSGNKRAFLGFADPNSRELWVESDSPATNLSQVLVHELTHFWQFDNIACDDMNYIEGQASFVEVQYMRSLGQKTWADRVEAQLEQRKDSYGIGYRRLKRELADSVGSNSFAYMKKKFGR